MGGIGAVSGGSYSRGSVGGASDATATGSVEDLVHDDLAPAEDEGLGLGDDSVDRAEGEDSELGLDDEPTMDVEADPFAGGDDFLDGLADDPAGGEAKGTDEAKQGFGEIEQKLQQEAVEQAQEAPKQQDTVPTPEPKAPAHRKPPTPQHGLHGSSQKHGAAQPAAPATPEQIVQEVMRDRPKGLVGDAVEYWDKVGQQGGLKGAAGKVMSGLLEFSGLPAVERDAAELGARVGAGDSKKNILKTGGKLAFDSGVVLMNGMAGGKAVTGLVGATRASEAALPTIVRHYTSVEKAAEIMKSGEIWATKAGNAGLNKVYMLAEDGSNQGMNFLRRLNVGYAKTAETAKAIEIDLSKLPPDVVANFQREAAKGPLSLEHFMTHQGSFKFNQFRDAVKLVDAQGMATTLEQLKNTGASMAKVGTLGQDVSNASQAAVR